MKSKASSRSRAPVAPTLDHHAIWELRGHAGILGSSARAPRLTESQIAFIFQQANERAPLAEICAAVGLSDAAYLNWRRHFGGLLPSEYDYVRALEAQVRRLQLELADLLDLPSEDESESV